MMRIFLQFPVSKKNTMVGALMGPLPNVDMILMAEPCTRYQLSNDMKYMYHCSYAWPMPDLLELQPFTWDHSGWMGNWWPGTWIAKRWDVWERHVPKVIFNGVAQQNWKKTNWSLEVNSISTRLVDWRVQQFCLTTIFRWWSMVPGPRNPRWRQERWIPSFCSDTNGL